MKNIKYLLPALLVASHIACDLKDPLSDLDCDEIILLEADRTSAIANGENNIILTATLTEEVKANLKVTFRTDYGSFEGSGQAKELEVTSIAKKAVARLVVTNEFSDFVVSAQVEDNCQQFISLSTTPSLPHFIDFQTDELEIKADRSEQAMLTVKLFRNPGGGTISNNLRVSFDAIANNSNAEADLPDFGFSTDGMVMVGLRSATDSTGVVTVTAMVESADGGVISESLDIEFVE